MKSTSISHPKGLAALCALGLAIGACSTDLASGGQKPSPTAVLQLIRYVQDTGGSGWKGSGQLLKFIEDRYLAPGLENIPARPASLILEALYRLQEPEKAWEALSRYDESLSEMKGFSAERCRYLRLAWSRENDWKKERVWARREYQALFGTAEGRGSVDSKTLLLTGKMLRHNLLTGPEFAYPEFTAVLLRLARSGELDEFSAGDCVSVCAPLQSEESLEMMRVALAGSKERPQPELLMVYAWSCHQAGRQGQCDELIKGILSHEEVEGDIKARWLAAAAKAGGLVVKHSPIPVTAGMRQAIAEARSPALRLQLLYETAGPHLAVRDYSKALQLLEETAGDFKDPVAQAGLLVMRAEASQAQAELEGGIRAAKARREKGGARGRRAELLRRLAAAKQRRDTREAARLEALLKRLSPPDQP